MLSAKPRSKLDESRTRFQQTPAPADLSFLHTGAEFTE